MQLTKLSFPIKRWDFNTDSMVDSDLFNCNVLSAVAKWVTMSDSQKVSLWSSPLFFCFGDTWGRVEWEFSVDKDGNMGAPFQDWSEKDLTGYEKTSVYDYYVKPNADKLMVMVNSVSRNSAVLYLKERTI